ncbi:MAG TPA: hypothetical protein VLI93_16455 [Acetobacteraceae bacterium]|nr:hypothetical protein [Acetobacteraceae bacterium]
MTIAAPRLLPATTVVIAALLGMKGLELVRAATPAGALGTAPAGVSRDAAGPATENASGKPPPPQAPTPPGTQVPAAQAASASLAAAPPPPVSDSERALLVELRQRRQELDAREQAIAARETVLVAAQRKIDQRVTELQTLQQRLEALEAARKQRQDASWQGLVRLYSDMKPRDAAKIWDDLEIQVLLEVVDRMTERKAAPILAAMQPDRAREITAKLAELRLKRDNPGG